MFGFTEAQIAKWGLTFGVGGLILLLLFIVLNLARQSKAGKFGTFILLLVLMLGTFGLIVKEFLVWFLTS